MMMMQPN